MPHNKFTIVGHLQFLFKVIVINKKIFLYYNEIIVIFFSTMLNIYQIVLVMFMSGIVI